MRILHVIPGLELRGGGGNRACAELCESLAALGHEVSICYVKNNDNNRCFIPKGVTVRAFPWRFLSGYAYSPQLRECLEQEMPKMDIVHIHATWQYPSLPASRIALKYGIPYVVQPHGNLSPWKLHHKRVRKWVYGHLVERGVLKRAAFIHTESGLDATDVRSYLPGAKMVICPCGAYPKAFTKKGPEGYIASVFPSLVGKICMLYLARIDVSKGVDSLLRAFAKLAVQRKDIALLLVGPDYAHTTNKMKKLSRRLGIADRVTWEGMVSGDEKVWLMQQCDFYVLPSLSENFGISVLEAMFCEKPVLTTTATPWKELREANAGIIVEPSVEAIYKGLQTMLDMSAEELSAMGRKGRALAKQKYEWSAIAKELAMHYEQAITRYRDRCK